MLPRLADLYHDYKDIHQLQLLAGEAGLSSSVSWVYMTEDIGNVLYLRGLELVITTGLASAGRPSWLASLVEQLLSSSCSGLIVNVGTYIHMEDISPEVLALCDSQGFPLFSMPWEVHISDVMQDFCNRIFLHIYQGNALTKLFQELLKPSDPSPELYAAFAEHGFLPEERYTALITDGAVSPVWLRGCLDARTHKYHFFPHADGLLLIFQNCPAEDISDFLEKLYAPSSNAQPGTAGRETISFFSGVGEPSASLRDLPYSLKQAVQARQIAQRRGRPYLFFRDLGVERLFLSIPDSAVLEQICQEALGPLEQYDFLNHTLLADTLAVYFQLHENIQDTADAMYTHRNTINYRMKKIRSILTMDLDHPDDRLMLMAACRIRKADTISLYLDHNQRNSDQISISSNGRR